MLPSLQADERLASEHLDQERLIPQVFSVNGRHELGVALALIVVVAAAKAVVHMTTCCGAAAHDPFGELRA
jgi:hypothetical protein